MSREPRTDRLVSLSLRWMSNGLGNELLRQAFDQAPQVRWARLVDNFVEHGLRDVNSHSALGQRGLVEVFGDGLDAVDIERLAVVLELDQDFTVAGGDRELDDAAAVALIRMDRDVIEDFAECGNHGRVERVAYVVAQHVHGIAAI